MRVFGKFGVAFVLMSALSVGVAPAARGSVISISNGPGTASTSVGDLFTIQVGISGLSGATNDSLSAFDLKVSYDQAAAGFVSASFIDPASGLNQLDLLDPYSFGFLGDAIDDGAGTISAFGLSGNTPDVLDTDQADNFVFLSLQFEALSSTAGAQFALLVEDPFILFGDSSFGELPVTFGSTAVLVAIMQRDTVPEPASTALVLVGLGALGLGRRRLRRATAMSLLGAGLAFGSGAHAAGPSKPLTTSAVTPASGKALDATVIEVKGQRMKIRTSSGMEQWVTTASPLNDNIVGQSVRGVVRPMGDAQSLESPTFD